MVKERFLREAMNFAGGDKKFAGRRKEMHAIHAEHNVLPMLRMYYAQCHRLVERICSSRII